MCFESTDWQRVSIRLVSDKSEWTVSFDKEFYRRQFQRKSGTLAEKRCSLVRC